MTKDGKENRFGRFVFEDSQAERIAAGDYSAVWEFIEDNRKFLTGWARKFVRYRLNFMPDDMNGSFYKPEELVNQVYVDFPLYNLGNEKTLGICIHCSFRGISCGGYKRVWHARKREYRLDAPIGDGEDGTTYADIMPSREPTPDAALVAKEHVQEIAPHFYHEIGRILRREEPEETEDGATVGEMLAYRNGGITPFQDVIEEVFFGYTFEEVRAYAKRTA